ncbi:hypothetical protein BVY03_03420 [bacterium K02(2017)]|nr:hypothetical protein BVY03_03420 [bacterium K02(2017)]
MPQPFSIKHPVDHRAGLTKFDLKFDKPLSILKVDELLLPVLPPKILVMLLGLKVDNVEVMNDGSGGIFDSFV